MFGYYYFNLLIKKKTVSYISLVVVECLKFYELILWQWLRRHNIYWNLCNIYVKFCLLLEEWLHQLSVAIREYHRLGKLFLKIKVYLNHISGGWETQTHGAGISLAR
jgi:hypothetical protein